MAKAIFFNVPAHGHINPSLPLVAELALRGHHVVYVATESFQRAIQATGATFRSYAWLGVPVNDDFFSSRGLNGTAPQRAAHALAVTTQDILTDLLSATQAEQPDVVMYDSMCPWGYFTARTLKLPAVASLSLLSPLMSPSALLRPSMLRLIASVLIHDFDKGLAANNISRALGRQYGVQPLGTMQLLNAPADLSISYSSSYFVPNAKRAPKNMRFVGWTPHDVSSAESVPVDESRPMVYASLGTLVNANVDFYRACIEAFADSPYSLVISTGNGLSADSFGALPSNVLVKAWVPQVAVLQRAALFITHGGVNSLHDGLWFGLPLLLVPQQAEQTINAGRVVELGAGISLDKTNVTAEAIRSNVSRLLSEPHFKEAAQRVSDSLRAAGGAKTGADEVEALIRQMALRAGAGAGVDA